MRLRRRAAGATLAIACGTAAAVGLPATAHASVQDTGTWAHIEGWGDGKCLTDPANAGLDPLEVEYCVNKPYEQWTMYDQAWKPNTDNLEFMLRNNATGRCAHASPPLQNGTAVLMVTCDPNDQTQWWITEHITDDIQHWEPLIGGCLDRPVQTDYNGEHMQIWGCDGPPSSWPVPGTGEHPEQNAHWTQSIG